MSIKGNLREASLPDVIQLLSLGKKTGVLSISDRKNFGDIFFQDGRITYCSIVNREDRIGQILLNQGDIKEEDLEKALQIQDDENNNRRIGDILVELNAITREMLYDRIRKQLTDTIFTFLTWEDGFFNFEPNIKPGEETITIKLYPEDILLEQARKVDEWSVIEDELPSEHSILMTTNIVDISNLNENEKAVLKLINSRRILKDIYEKSHLEKYETAKAVYGLKKIGYIYVGEEVDATSMISNKEKINEHYNLGLAFLLTEMFEEALREFKYIVQIDKANAIANFYIGMINFRTKKYTDAMKAFEDLLKLGVNNVALFNNVGLTLEKLGQYERAEDFYERALKLDPENARVNANFGILSFHQNILSDAEEKLRVALRINPGMNYARFFLALVCLENGKINEAIDEFLKVTKKDPGIWHVYYNIGQIYINLEKYESAEYMIKKAMDNSDRDIVCYKSLIDLYFKDKNFKKAEALLEEAILIHQKEFDFFYKLGNLKYKKADKKHAIIYWEKALLLQPENMILKKTLDTVKNG